MIPIDDKKSVTEHGFTGFERQQFTIAVTKESFKILIDGLYQRKVTAVIRELATNAYDSHREAGKEDVPFEVRLPSLVDASFSVRDFGVSMTHDQIMHQYSSVFTSTKTNTNTQVGQLGLGSKSPFAYTDSFTVTAWKNNAKRTYLASLGTDGIPSITFLMMEDSDEPDGIEVSFPVQARHYYEFQQEAEDLMIDFPVRPVFYGPQVEVSSLIVQFENWAQYPELNYHRYYVRQGCVRYPCEAPSEFRDLVRTGSIIIDVPIGSVAVAASREALSLDDTTQAYVREMFRELQASIDRYVSAALTNCTTYLGAIKEASRINATFSAKVSTWRGRPIPSNGIVDLNDGMRPELDIRVIQKSGREVQEIRLDHPKLPWTTLETATFWVDRGQRIPRRKMRLAEKMYSTNYLLRNPTSKQLAAFVKRWELRPNQIKSITTIPDVAITRQRSLVRSGIYKLDTYGDLAKVSKEDFEDIDDFLVIPIDKAAGGSCHFPKLRFTVYTRQPQVVKNYTTALGITAPVFFVTPQAFKQLDGSSYLWEDAVYDLLTESKDEVLRDYEEGAVMAQFRTHVSEALIEAGILTGASAMQGSKISNLVRQVFETEFVTLTEKAQEVSRKILKQYPLLAHIDYYSYSRNNDDVKGAIVDYILLKKEA